jgi:glycosyltransferase involved in cell wall biosynthesis
VCEKVDARLRIVGSDQSEGKIQQFSADLGLKEKVEFVGSVPHSEMPGHYHWTHFLIHSSRHEAQGVVVAEAAATGALVAGSRTGLLADFGDALALTVPACDYEALAKRILDIVESPERYHLMRRASRAWATGHDMVWSVSQYLSLYDRLSISGERGASHEVA